MALRLRSEIVDFVLKSAVGKNGGSNETKEIINGLLRRIQNSSGAVESLMDALTLKHSKVSRCVLMANSLDGRIQINSKKYFPHLVSFKIFRCEDVELRDLKPLCEFGFKKDSQSICINPYHYDNEKADLNADFEPFFHFSEIEKRLVEMYGRHKNSCCNFWSSVQYFEYSIPQGDPFSIERVYSCMYITGNMISMYPQEFAIGSIVTSPKNDISDKSKQYILSGITVDIDFEQNIHIYHNSYRPVFVQLDMIEGPVIFKMVSDEYIEVFNLSKIFSIILKDIRYLESTININVFEEYFVGWKNMCCASVSFNKGFGPGYKLGTPEESPTWIRITYSVGIHFITEIIEFLKNLIDST